MSLTAPPRIVQDVRPNRVIREGEGTHFRCIAQGYPAPTISWQHAGREIVNSENLHFRVNSTERSDGFIITVTSFLILRSADDSLNGEVRCVASPPLPEMVGGMTLDNDYTKTQLSVLGKYTYMSKYYNITLSLTNAQVKSEPMVIFSLIFHSYKN